jgi:hypothetical protein
MTFNEPKFPYFLCHFLRHQCKDATKSSLFYQGPAQNVKFEVQKTTIQKHILSHRDDGDYENEDILKIKDIL